MATLTITEYHSMAAVPNTNGQMPMEPPLADSAIAITGGSTQSAVFQSGTRYVRLHCDIPCRVLFGTNPTATLSNQRLAANQTEFKGVPEGGGLQVAVIQSS